MSLHDAPEAGDLPNLLLTDDHLAEMLNVSTAWVKRQRYLRRKSANHVLTVDPVLIGDMPRYRVHDIAAWLNTL